jgi:hypothetical protein
MQPPRGAARGALRVERRRPSRGEASPPTAPSALASLEDERAGGVDFGFGSSPGGVPSPATASPPSAASPPAAAPPAAAGSARRGDRLLHRVALSLRAAGAEFDVDAAGGVRLLPLHHAREARPPRRGRAAPPAAPAAPGNGRRSAVACGAAAVVAIAAVALFFIASSMLAARLAHVARRVSRAGPGVGGGAARGDGGGNDAAASADAESSCADSLRLVAQPWAALIVPTAREMIIAGAAGATRRDAFDAAAALPTAALFLPHADAATAAAAAPLLAAAACDPFADGPEAARAWGGVNVSAPLAAAMLRPDTFIAARLDFVDACLAMRLPPEVVAATLEGRRPEPAPRALSPPPAPLTSRAALAAHGADIAALVNEFAVYHGLLGPAGWADHGESTGYAGPWIEDYWRATFARTVYVRFTPESARARARALADEGVSDAGAAWALFECARAPRGADYAAFAAAAAAGTCSRAELGSDAVAALPPGEAVGTRRALFLALPYDTELFHPFVPLFVPWENAVFAGSAARAWNRFATGRAPLDEHYVAVLSTRPALKAQPLDLEARLAALLNATLRLDVAYVTVTQRPSGPWLSPDFEPILARTLVLSSGGGGHVALPLLARELPALRVANASSAARGAGPLADLADITVPPYGAASHALSFLGSSRSGTREYALDALRGAAPGYVNEAEKVGAPHFQPASWLPAFVDTTLALAPRGTGATSFRLYEALQAGVPPVYVSDAAHFWLPYRHPGEAVGVGVPLAEGMSPALPPPRGPRAPPRAFQWDALAHVVELGPLAAWARDVMPALVAPGSAVGREKWEAMRAAAAAARGAYFTYDGVMRHVWRFVADPWAAELFCAPSAPP